MQIYVLAAIALTVISTVQAGGVAESSANNSSSGSGVQEAGVSTIVTPAADWRDCTEDLRCETQTSVCVRHSEYYAQCKPVVLPSGDLCGQSDGTNEWLYDHCPADEKCSTKGKDFRCVKPGKHRHHHHKRSDRSSAPPTTVPPTTSAPTSNPPATTAPPAADWQDCTKVGTCKTPGSTCVKHSDYYSQCTPAILPTGGLCGQNLGPNVWKYDGHCATGETCQATGTDFHCRPTSTTTPPPTTNPPSGITYVLDWEDCSKPNMQCKTTTSSCVKISNYYSQCLPATLTSGSLCGQSGANNWRYDHCPTGETCKTVGLDSRCTK